MPITIHTSPAVVTDDTSPVTTASFTSVSGGLLVAMVAGSSDDPPSVSGGGLTWTRRIQQAPGSARYAEIWTAPVVTGASMTVAATLTGSFSALGVKVDVISGQHSTSPIGATGGGTTTTNNATVNGYTSTADGSRGWCAAFEFEGLGLPTSSDTGFPWSIEIGGFVEIDGVAIRKAADTASSSTNVTFNMDAGGTGTADWTWAALEIVPAVVSRQSTFVSRAAVHRAASW